MTNTAGFHARNRHQGRYDFTELLKAHPPLQAFVRPNAYADESIDFADPQAVRALNAALLAQHYGIKDWNIPPQYLCPPIPSRADYVHHLADLLAADNKGKCIGRINALFTQVQQLWTAVDSFDTPAMQPNPADGEPATLKIYPPLSH